MEKKLISVFNSNKGGGFSLDVVENKYKDTCGSK